VGTSWIDAEPGFLDTTREIARLFRRARARSTYVVGIALAITVLSMVREVRRVPLNPATVIYRVVEGDLEENTALRPPRDLTQYVWSVVFSRTALLEVIRSFHLFPRHLERDPMLAVEAMRDSLDVDTWQNYFLEARYRGGEGRTARLSITYRDIDPDRALAVAHALGKLLERSAEAARAELADIAVEATGDSVRSADQEIARAEREIAVIQLAVPNVRPLEAVQLRNELDALNLKRRNLYALRDTLRKRQAAMTLRAAIERNDLGLSFELIDGGEAKLMQPDRPRDLLLKGGALFTVLLLLVALTMGAFDDRVHSLADVQSLGLVGVAHIRHFPGDDVGALEARLHSDYTKGS
jgi:hypothetical protein